MEDPLQEGSIRLQDTLIQIALDSCEVEGVRVSAAYALRQLGDSGAKAQLKPLAVGDTGEDPNDDLKGWVLLVVWPNYLTADELFAHLSRPKRQSLFGTYDRFLRDELVSQLQPEALPRALHWVISRGRRHDLPFVFQDLVDSIVWLARDDLDDPEVISSFVDVTLLLLQSHEALVQHTSDKSFQEQLDGCDVKRRRLLQAVVPRLPETEIESDWLVYTQTPLALAKDFYWILNQLDQTQEHPRPVSHAWLAHG